MKRIMLLLGLLPLFAIAQTTIQCQPNFLGSVDCTSRSAPAARGIDFGALQRGRREAEQDNMQNQLYRQQQELIELQRLQLLKQQETAGMYAGQAQASQYDLKADLYLSNIENARNQAIAGGMSPSDFWNGTYRQMLADTTFKSMPQQMQEAVLAKFKRLYDMLETKF